MIQYHISKGNERMGDKNSNALCVIRGALKQKALNFVPLRPPMARPRQQWLAGCSSWLNPFFFLSCPIPGSSPGQALLILSKSASHLSLFPLFIPAFIKTCMDTLNNLLFCQGISSCLEGENLPFSNGDVT